MIFPLFLSLIFCCFFGSTFCQTFFLNQNEPNICLFVNKVARETNEELRAIQVVPAEGFDVGAILSIARRYSFSCPGKNLGFKCL